MKMIQLEPCLGKKEGSAKGQTTPLAEGLCAENEKGSNA